MEKSTGKVYDVIVIGGGAAGFFGAIQIAEMKAGLKILLLEKTTKLLTKVKVSGGGRCNVTHKEFNPIKLAAHYPRGSKQLKALFKKYNAANVVDWFQSKGIALNTEADGRMFPASNSSQTIIDCFLDQAKRLGIEIEINSEIIRIIANEKVFSLTLKNETELRAKKILLATGGSPKVENYALIKNQGLPVVAPIPSLFTFNEPSKSFQDLMGIALPNAEVKVVGTKFVQSGPLLITHWGLSGPAVIKLSAWAAEYLAAAHYSFKILVSWIGPAREEEVRAYLQTYQQLHPKKKIVVNPLYEIPTRLWSRLCELAEIEEEKVWSELSKYHLNKLLEALIRSPFDIKGKTTFKDEFVTCGGVDLAAIDIETMQSKMVSNLFFAGEVVNIDGETGGFNFQAAWTTAYVAACAIVKQ